MGTIVDTSKMWGVLDFNVVWTDWFILLWVVACVLGILLLYLDADFTTIFYDKLGGDLSKHLRDKVIWITGASSGIGAALAVEASRHGAKLVLTARRTDALEEVKQNCIKQGNISEEDILVLPLDMCDLQSHSGALKKVLDKFGKLSVLINNAGRSQRARWEHTDIAVDKDMFELNVFSIINLTRLVLPHMLDTGEGTVAVMSSCAGKSGVPFSGTYTASKHALHGYFESLRTEKVGSGVDICMLCPGPTFSELLQVAATEKQGEKFGQEMHVTDKRMTAERCAHLSLVAIAHHITESWICFFPALPMMYAVQYFPTISKLLIKLLGPKFLMTVRDSRNAMEKGEIFNKSD